MPNVSLIETKCINDIFLDVDFITDLQIILISYQYYDTQYIIRIRSVVCSCLLTISDGWHDTNSFYT